VWVYVEHFFRGHHGDSGNQKKKTGALRNMSPEKRRKQVRPPVGVGNGGEGKTGERGKWYEY